MKVMSESNTHSDRADAQVTACSIIPSVRCCLLKNTKLRVVAALVDPNLMGAFNDRGIG